MGEAGNGVLHAAVEGSVFPDSWAREIVSPLREALAAEGGSLVVERAPLDLKRAADVWGPMPGRGARGHEAAQGRVRPARGAQSWTLRGRPVSRWRRGAERLRHHRRAVHGRA